MDRSASPKADKTPQTSPEAPFTTFIQLDGKSPLPSAFHTPGTFILRDIAWFRQLTLSSLVGDTAKGRLENRYNRRCPHWRGYTSPSILGNVVFSD